MADYREAFAIFDQNSDGVISAQELKTMMGRLGNPVDDREVRDIITEAGSLSTNSITQVAALGELRLAHRAAACAAPRVPAARANPRAVMPER
jgi:hypothetical protein